MLEIFVDFFQILRNGTAYKLPPPDQCSELAYFLVLPGKATGTSKRATTIED